jgi:hypothetical protein
MAQVNVLVSCGSVFLLCLPSPTLFCPSTDLGRDPSPYHELALLLALAWGPPYESVDREENGFSLRADAPIIDENRRLRSLTPNR